MIKVDLSIYESRLRGDIGSDLNALKIVLDSLALSSYDSRKYILRQGFTISEINTPPKWFIE